MVKANYVMENMQAILNVANSEINCYGVRLDTIMLTNCAGDSFDAKFIFSAQATPSYDTKQSVQRIVRSVLLEFIARYIPSTYTMNHSEYVYYF